MKQRQRQRRIALSKIDAQQVNNRPRGRGIRGGGLQATAFKLGWLNPASVAQWAGALLVIVLAAAIVLIASNPDAPAAFLRPEDRLVPADAVLVFSGDPYYARTQEAARLYRLGYVRYLVFSGRGGPGDSATSMALVAHRSGVPGAALLVDSRATSTYQNVLFVRWLLMRHDIHKLILVTSPYHQRRAYLVARRLLPGMILINHPIRVRYWQPHNWWWNPPLRRAMLGEYAKIAGYLFLGRI